jgi:hypothetical protein
MKTKNLSFGFWIFALLFVSSSVVLAQDQVLTPDIDASAFSEKTEAMQNVEVSFCQNNGVKSIDYDVYL